MYRKVNRLLALIIAAVTIVFMAGACATKDGTTGTATAAVSASKTTAKATASTGAKTTAKATASSAATAGGGSASAVSTAAQTGDGQEDGDGTAEATDGQESEGEGEGEGTTENGSEASPLEIDYDFQGRTIYLVNVSAAMPERILDYDLNLINQYTADGTYIKGYSEADDARYDYWRRIEEAMNCKIRVKWYTMNHTQLIQKNTTDILSGSFDYDISYMSGALPNFVKNGFLYALDDLADVKSIPKLNLGERSVIRYKGKIYSVKESNTAMTVHINYNPEIAAREGITDLFALYQNGQWTWDRLIDVGVKATRDFNGDGIVDQWGIVYASAGDMAVGMLRANGTTVVEYDAAAGKFNLNLSKAGVRRAIQYLSDLINVYKMGPVGGGSYAIYYNGSALMLGGGMGDYYTYTVYNKSGLKSRFVPYPIGPDNEEGKFTNVMSTAAYYIPTGTKDPQGAAAVMINLLQAPNDPDKYKVSYETLVKDQKAYMQSRMWPGVLDDWADLIDYWVRELRGYDLTCVSDTKTESVQAWGVGAGSIGNYFATQIKTMITTNANIVSTIDSITPTLENMLADYN